MTARSAFRGRQGNVDTVVLLGYNIIVGGARVFAVVFRGDIHRGQVVVADIVIVDERCVEGYATRTALSVQVGIASHVTLV